MPMLGDIPQTDQPKTALTVTVALLFDKATVADIRRLAEIAAYFEADDAMPAEPHYAELDDREPDGIMFVVPVIADL